MRVEAANEADEENDMWVSTPVYSNIKISERRANESCEVVQDQIVINDFPYFCENINTERRSNVINEVSPKGPLMKLALI